MTYIFENETGRELDGILMESTGREVIETTLDEIGCPFDVQVNLTVTDSEAIKEINREFRGIDRPTDVLSFPLSQFPAPGDFSQLEAYADRMEESEEETGLTDEDDLGDCFDSETGELLLGDIVINIDRVFTQAEEYGHSLLREYAFLIVHSVLHLVGYDHMEAEEAAVMEAKQEEILSGLGICT